MQQEVSAFLVRHTAVCVIRVFPNLEVDDQMLIFWSRLILLERVAKRLRTDQVREPAFGRGVKDLL